MCISNTFSALWNLVLQLRSPLQPLLPVPSSCRKLMSKAMSSLNSCCLKVAYHLCAENSNGPPRASAFIPIVCCQRGEAPLTNRAQEHRETLPSHGEPTCSCTHVPSLAIILGDLIALVCCQTRPYRERLKLFNCGGVDRLNMCTVWRLLTRQEQLTCPPRPACGPCGLVCLPVPASIHLFLRRRACIHAAWTEGEKGSIHAAWKEFFELLLDCQWEIPEFEGVYEGHVLFLSDHAPLILAFDIDHGRKQENFYRCACESRLRRKCQ